MSIDFAQAAVKIVAGYLLTGLLFAMAFIWRGAAGLDRRAQNAGWPFRLALVPASIALWPWLLRRWLQTRSQTGESSS